MHMLLGKPFPFTHKYSDLHYTFQKDDLIITFEEVTYNNVEYEYAELSLKLGEMSFYNWSNTHKNYKADVCINFNMCKCP